MNVLADNDELLNYIEIWSKIIAFSIKNLIKKAYIIMNT